MSIKSAIAIIESLTKDVSTDASTKVSSAVNELVNGGKVAHSETPSKMADYLWDTFNDVFELAGKTAPDHQRSIIDLLVGLRKNTILDDGTCQPVRIEAAGEGAVWRDLPSFGWVARDLWNFDAFDPSATPEDRAKWENQTAFLAQLTHIAGSENEDDPFDFTLYALWALRDAFETTHPEGSDPTTALRLAGRWIGYAGNALQLATNHNRSFLEKMGSPGDRYADRQWTGFNEERWDVWRQAFQAAGEGEADVEDDTKNLARNAAESMG